MFLRFINVIHAKFLFVFFRNKITDFIHVLVGLLIFGFLGWILMLILHEHVQPVSRKMANFSYCIWVVSTYYSNK